MLSNLSNTPYQKSCRWTREWNSSILNFSSGWKLTKFIILPWQMRTSRPPLSNVSIEPWNQSCGVISLDMTRYPIWLYWTHWWTSTTAPHIAVSVWHPMTSLPEIKWAFGSDSMLTPHPIKNLLSMLETQYGAARRDRHSRRDICLSGRKRWSLSWKKKVLDFPCLFWPITTGKCWKAHFILRNCKRWPGGMMCIEKILKRIESWSNSEVIQTNSTVGGMWKISCDVLVLLLFLSGILLRVFLMREVETLAFGDDYLLVECDVNDSKSTSSPVWWRTAAAADMHGVVLEVRFPRPKSSTSVKCYSFYLWFWPAFTTWPINKEINSFGWHYWVVVWVISYPIHRSNHNWLLSYATL